jgi:hypothetical protein
MTTKTYDENWAKKKLKALLDELGVMNFPIPAGGMGVSGISDRLGLKNGMFIAIEVKRPGRRGEANRGCSALQAKFLNGVSRFSGIALVFDGEDDDVAALKGVLDSPEEYEGYNTLTLNYWKKK